MIRRSYACANISWDFYDTHQYHTDGAVHALSRPEILLRVLFLHDWHFRFPSHIPAFRCMWRGTTPTYASFIAHDTILLPVAQV